MSVLQNLFAYKSVQGNTCQSETIIGFGLGCSVPSNIFIYGYKYLTHFLTLGAVGFFPPH